MWTSSSTSLADVRPGQMVVSQKLTEKAREMRHPARVPGTTRRPGVRIPSASPGETPVSVGNSLLNGPGFCFPLACLFALCPRRAPEGPERQTGALCRA